MMRGREQAAHQSLASLRGLGDDDEYFAREYNDLKGNVSANTETVSGWIAMKNLLGSCLSDPPSRKLLLFVMLVQTFFIMSGGNSITYYAPTILKSIGLNSTQVLLFTAVYGLIKVASVFLYAFVLTERFGRRPLLLIGSAINTVCLLYLAVYLGCADPSTQSASPSPAAWVAIVAICSFAIGYGFGWAPVFSLTAAEICPTPTRGTVVSIAFVYQNLLNFGITRAFPNMTVSMHIYGPFALFTAFTGLATTWVFFAYPECKGRSMESVSTLFSLPWYRIGAVKVDERKAQESAEASVDLEKASSSQHHEYAKKSVV